MRWAEGRRRGFAERAWRGRYAELFPKAVDEATAVCLASFQAADAALAAQ